MKLIGRIFTMLLTLSLLTCAFVPAYAAKEEEYLSELRIIYASSYKEAKQILADTEFADYEILDANLNENTGKIGVWLAYKTTTDIEDAITDIAVMQMKGGYNEGNYQKMIKQSYEAYVALGENYVVAIDYFENALRRGDYLAEVAYRQLNFYNIVTEGISEIPYFEGELLGDIFVEGISATDVATIFMEGNTYALDNIRSLLAMGVSYNKDGLTYLEKVAGEAEAFGADPDRYQNEDHHDLAAVIAPTIVVLGTMLSELGAYEAELNYEDEEYTDLELKYMEHKLIAEMLRGTDYLDGKTLYDFCLSYSVDKEDYSALYPLVASLNSGQAAMTRVAHYYDVLRYSMPLQEQEVISAALDELEAEYGETPFNVYTGVDRTIYRDSFALTNAAYRADAYTESGLENALFGDSLAPLNIGAVVIGSIGTAVVGAGLARHGYLAWNAKKAMDAAKAYKADLFNQFADGAVVTFRGESLPLEEVLNQIYSEVPAMKVSSFDSMSFADKYDYMLKFFRSHMSNQHYTSFNLVRNKMQPFLLEHNDAISKASIDAVNTANSLNAGLELVYTMYFVGGFLMVLSAITLGANVFSYYYPSYDDIPTSMVDMIQTVDGDRYIKYNVVYEAERQRNGEYAAADLNAFKAQRWNALYYTKSYEAGKPLLADEFVISTKNNVPGNQYAPVHRFGEVVSYNLNKYNYNETHSIYLSVKQSENQKAAVADVPELVGSMLSAGVLCLAGGVGVAIGVGCTIGTQGILKKKKSKATTEA